MYSKIKDLQRKGFSIRQTASILQVSRTTVSKYQRMTLDEYMETAETVRKLSSLDEYKSIILDWLNDFPSMTAAQVYDWLLEHYTLDISERSVSRYVKALRAEYNIVKVKQQRDYEAIDELPMGHQMQLDFGEKNMPLPDRKGHKKVYFMGVVLAHSRYKWGYFQDRPFTTETLIYALRQCFHFFGGVTKEIVIDQDSIIVTNENLGDIIYTYTFEQFKQQHKLNIHVCRKADPESKGKVENVVKYIKRNFLPHRSYMEMDHLNAAFGAWLNRTGNAKVHGITKKVPAKVFEVEREHLRPILITEENFCSPSIIRHVRKDNTILYNSNRYSVPLGTHHKHPQVSLIIDGERLQIYNEFHDYIIAEHQICSLKGKLIKLSEHRRDKEKSLDQMEARILDLLQGEWSNDWRLYLKQIRTLKSRYYRDQLTLLNELIIEHESEVLDEAMIYCSGHDLYSINDIRNACIYMNQYNLDEVHEPLIEPNYEPVTNKQIMEVITQKRSLQEYDLTGGGYHE